MVGLLFLIQQTCKQAGSEISMYYFDKYGWYTSTPIVGRETIIAPDTLSETVTPGEIRANFTGHEWVALPYTTPPPIVDTPLRNVPNSVTMRQARLALLGAGLLASVDAAIDSLPSPQKEAARIEWEYATEVQRSSGLVPMVMVALGLDDAALDALFIEAEGL